MASSRAPPGRLESKVAIVTGSSSGIGRGIAMAYAREGAKVVCADLQPHSKEAEQYFDSQGNVPPHFFFDYSSTHDLITHYGGKAAFFKVDVANAEEVESLIAKAVKRFGRLDILVNNAGICPEAETSTPNTFGQPIHLTSLSTYDKTMNVNARGTFLCCKYGIAQMMQQDPLLSGQRGWVINIAAAAGLVAFMGSPAYCCSKGAVVNLTRQVAFDYGKHKIHVNAICPGAINTSMLQVVCSSDAMRAGVEAQTPWSSVGEPKDVAGAAVFLASEDAGFVTGAILSVDGGWTAH